MTHEEERKKNYIKFLEKQTALEIEYHYQRELQDIPNTAEDLVEITEELFKKYPIIQFSLIEESESPCSDFDDILTEGSSYFYDIRISGCSYRISTNSYFSSLYHEEFITKIKDKLTNFPCCSFLSFDRDFIIVNKDLIKSVEISESQQYLSLLVFSIITQEDAKLNFRTNWEMQIKLLGFIYSNFPCTCKPKSCSRLINKILERPDNEKEDILKAINSLKKTTGLLTEEEINALELRFALE